LFISVFRNGIPLAKSPEEVRQITINLAKSSPLPAFVHSETWEQPMDSNQLQMSTKSLSKRSIWLEPPTKRGYTIQNHRLHEFTEELRSWNVPLNTNKKQIASSLAVLPDNSVHGNFDMQINCPTANFHVYYLVVLVKYPLGLHSFYGADDGEER